MWQPTCIACYRIYIECDIVKLKTKWKESVFSFQWYLFHNNMCNCFWLFLVSNTSAWGGLCHVYKFNLLIILGWGLFYLICQDKSTTVKKSKKICYCFAEMSCLFLFHLFREGQVELGWVGVSWVGWLSLYEVTWVTNPTYPNSTCPTRGSYLRNTIPFHRCTETSRFWVQQWAKCS